MDAFYASVEQRDYEAYRGKPLAVGGSRERGVVAAASYEARKFGVRSAMPSVQAYRLCPHIIFVKPRFDVYSEVSQEIRQIFKQYTDLVEPLSLDEAYLDVTQDKKEIHSATLIAQKIKEQIYDETRLTASAGVSYNKFLAKIASDYHKPDGLKVILPDEALAFLEVLPVEKFYGIGKVTARKMHQFEIRTGAELKERSFSFLHHHFGKAGRFYYQIVRGIDNRQVTPDRIRKSVSTERTYPTDLDELNMIQEKILELSEDLVQRLEKNQTFGNTLTLKVKFSDFTQITRSTTIPVPLREVEQIRDLSLGLMQTVSFQEMAIRLLGLSISNLNLSKTQDSGIQLRLNFP